MRVDPSPTCPFVVCRLVVLLAAVRLFHACGVSQVYTLEHYANDDPASDRRTTLRSHLLERRLDTPTFRALHRQRRGLGPNRWLSRVRDEPVVPARLRTVAA